MTASDDVALGAAADAGGQGGLTLPPQWMPQTGADRLSALVLMALSLAAGSMYLVAVRPGIPYDEPSHFNVVQLYARFHGLPVVGRPGVTYEAYHPPLYYALLGLWYRVVASGLGPSAAFYATRGATLLLFPPLVHLVYRLGLAATGRRVVAWGAALFIAINPSFLAICSTVQNDSLMFLLSTAAAYTCVAWLDRPAPSVARSTLLGLIVGGALLTKTSALPVVVIVVAFLIARWGCRGVVPAAVVLLVVALTTGWWFARNVRLYGDWTGAKAVGGIFDHGERFHLTSPGDWARAGRGVVTYYTLPVEYWRNDVKASLFDRGLVAASSVWLAAAAAMVVGKRSYEGSQIGRDNRRRAAGATLAAFAIAGFGFWLTICVRHYIVAPRVGMTGLAGVALLVAVLSQRAANLLSKRWAAAVGVSAIILVLVALNIGLLVAVRRIPSRPYEIRFPPTALSPSAPS